MTRSAIPFGLDTDDLADPRILASLPALDAANINPSEEENEVIRAYLIRIRRQAGLPDYPETERDQSSAAD